MVSPEPSPSGVLKPDAIYLRAIRAMQAEPLPAYVVFREDVAARNAGLSCTSDGTSFSLKHGDEKLAYRVWYRVSDGSSVTQNLATHALCHGSLLVPSGADIVSLGTAHASPSPSAAASTAQPKSADSSPSPSPDASSNLDVNTDAPGSTNNALIGAVRVEASRYYRIEIADREPFEGHEVYRLTLHAYRDPNLHPITEMLVDTQTFLVHRVSGEVSGHYVIASGRGAGTVVFDRMGRYWVVRDENFVLAFNALFIHARTNLDVRGSEYQFADALPNIAFQTPMPSRSPSARK